MFESLKSNKAINSVGRFIKNHPFATGIPATLAGIYAYGKISPTSPETVREAYQWAIQKGATREEALQWIRASHGEQYIKYL